LSSIVFKFAIWALVTAKRKTQGRKLGPMIAAMIPIARIAKKKAGISQASVLKVLFSGDSFGLLMAF
jgi:hypothetical protein